jgi:ABC-type nitrate/sulfonate/bicarbonate transport system ATPase subunit
MWLECRMIANLARSQLGSDGQIFELADVEFTYNVGMANELRVFSGLSESFRSGEFVSLLGPSGCGKTTLLDIIAGIYQPTCGSLRWYADGLRLGYLFQDYPFLPQSTVGKHLAFPLLMAGRETADIRREVDSWLDKVGLSDYSSYPIRSLSVGMKARVALATVLIASPQPLLLDEPFRALDLETRVQMWGHLKGSQAAGSRVTLLVTHDLNEAIALSDRILIFSRTPSRIIARVTMPFDPALDPLRRLATQEAGEIHQQLWAGLRRALTREASL